MAEIHPRCIIVKLSLWDKLNFVDKRSEWHMGFSGFLWSSAQVPLRSITDFTLEINKNHSQHLFFYSHHISVSWSFLNTHIFPSPADTASPTILWLSPYLFVKKWRYNKEWYTTQTIGNCKEIYSHKLTIS